MASVFSLRTTAIRPSTPTTRVLRLDLDGARFPFRAGQAVTLGLHGANERRPYSIASAPEEVHRDGWIEFLVKVDEDGRPGAHLAGWDPGALVDVEGPIGRFCVPEPATGRRFLFVAGGTGIAPLRSMIWHLRLSGSTARLRLVQSARSPAEFAFADEFRRLAAEGRVEWYPTVTGDHEDWTGPRGRVDRDLLTSLVDDPDTLCFVCGPPGMVATVRSLLGRLGVPDERVRREDW